jgi:lipoprotein-releasing system ATP-binding protein
MSEMEEAGIGVQGSGARREVFVVGELMMNDQYTTTPSVSPPQTQDPGRQTPGSPLLTVSNLHKHYRIGGQDLHVLRGADLDVGRGEWVAVLGASGSGKSTLLHLIGGLDRPDLGSVTFDSRDIFKLPGGAIDRYRNRHVGFVFQSYHLLPELTALENVLTGSMIRSSILGWPGRRGEAIQRATELLSRVGLGERMKHRPSKLSGGERQRVAIARALVNEPDLLLADEPTGNLDTETGKQIMELIAELHQQGQTIVMVTHDHDIAAAADRRLWLREGSLVEA